jgi:hypothetical protein
MMSSNFRAKFSDIFRPLRRPSRIRARSTIFDCDLTTSTLIPPMNSAMPSLYQKGALGTIIAMN